MFNKTKRSRNVNKPKPVIKPVKAWAVLNSNNEIEAITTQKDKSLVSIAAFCGEKVIRVEIRAV